MNKKKTASFEMKRNQAYYDYIKKRESVDYEAMDKAIRSCILSISEIAREHSVSDRFVRDRLHKIGMDLEERQRERSKMQSAKRFSDRLKASGLNEDSLREVFDDLTLTKRAIQDKYGLSQATIEHFLAKFGIDGKEYVKKARKPRSDYKKKSPNSSQQLSNINFSMNGERSLWLLSHDWKTPIRNEA